MNWINSSFKASLASAIVCIAASMPFANVLAQTADICKVPHFTATSEVNGKNVQINTLTSQSDCTARAKKLAFYGKWKNAMESEERGLYASKWITNGEAESREMADFIAKTNALSGSVDLLSGYAKGFENIFINDATSKQIAIETIKIVAKTIDYFKVVFVVQEKSAEVHIATLTSDTLRLFATTTSCIDKKDIKNCIGSIKGAIKTQSSFSKVFGTKVLDKRTEEQITGWLEFLIDAAEAAKNIGKYSQASSTSSGYLAVGALIDVTAKASTGEYWKDKSANPKFWDEFIMATATATSAWTKCRGAAISLVDEQKKFIGNTSECVSSTVKAAVNNMSSLMSRSTVLYKASQDVYEAKKYQMGRMLFDERFEYQSFDDLFRKYNVPLTAVDKNAQLIERFAQKIGYNYRLELARVLQVWSWMRWGDEVAIIMDKYANSMNEDAKALESGRINSAEYAKNSLVRFINTSATVELKSIGNIIWDGKSSKVITVISKNHPGQVSLELTPTNLLTPIVIPMVRASNSSATPDVSTLDLKDLANASLSGALSKFSIPSGSYQMKALVTTADGKKVASPPTVPATMLTVSSVSVGPVAPVLKATLNSSEVQSTSPSSPVVLRGTAVGKEPVVIKVQFLLPSGQLHSQDTATRNTTTGVWELNKSFPQAGIFAYQVDVSDASGAALKAVGKGRIDVSAAKPILTTPPTPVVPPIPTPIPNVTMFDFMPRELMAEQNVKFVAYTSSKSRLVKIVFDQFPGGPEVDMSNPNGNGTEWILERPVNTAGTTANNFQRNVWVVATAPDGRVSPPEGPRLITVKPKSVTPPSAQQALISGIQVQGALTMNSLATINFKGQNLTVETRVTLANCENPQQQLLSAMQIRLQCIPRQAGQQSVSWKVNAASPPNTLGTVNVNPTAQPTPLPLPLPVPAPAVTMFDFSPKDIVVGNNVRFVAHTNAKSKTVRLVFEQIQGGPTVEMSNPNGNGIDWELDRPITMPGQASGNFQRQFWVVATGLDGQISPAKGPHFLVVKPTPQTPVPTPTPAPQPPVVPPAKPPVTTPPQPVLPPVPVTPGSPQIRSVSPLSASLGQKTRMIVSGTGLPMTIKLQLLGEQCSGSLKGDFTQREFECTVNNNSSPKQLTVTTIQGAVLAQYSFMVQPGNALPVPTPPSIPEQLKPVMIKGDSIPSGLPWSAKLTTNLPVYSADLVFTTGRRIPFDGGATSWYTNDRNAVFGDAGSFPYSLQIRRQATSALETYPGGVLNVIAPVAPVISPMVTSAASAEQGRAYNLTIKSAATADRVTVKWPDSSSEEELKALDTQRTQWEFRDRLFMQAQQVSFVVKVYKDGFIQPVGQINGTLNVTAPAASMRLLEISKNVVQGDSPLFKVATSLSISRVTLQLGSDPAVSLAGTGGSGAEQNFRGQVLAKVAGQGIPYVITAFNTQGQAATQLNGTIAVSSIGDSLRLPNPIPTTGIAQGDYVNWKFVTNKATDEMWMEFDQPIGRIALNGSFLTRVFNEIPGSYKYQLMRKNQLGFVYPIQGANGILQIKARTAAPVAISRAILNGIAIAPGGAVSLKLNGPLNLQAIAQGAKSVVMSVNIPALGGPVYFESTSLDGTNWTNKPLPTATLGDYFRGQVKPGNYPARLYLGTGGSNTDVGGAIDFTIQIVP